MLTAGALFSLALMNMLAAEPAPSLSLADIAANVAKATTPGEEYQVDVTQTIAKTGAAQSEPPSRSTFVVTWTPSAGVATSKPTVESAGKDTEKTQASPSVQVQIDLLRSLKDLQKWKDIAVAAEQLDGRACAKISAKNPNVDMSSVVWVDTERWCVVRIIVEGQGKRIIDGAFEHRRVNDACWLLSKANMKQESDGTVIYQEYGVYSIEKK